MLEVKNPNILTAMYEARLRGYDRASSKEHPSQFERSDGRITRKVVFIFTCKSLLRLAIFDFVG